MGEWASRVRGFVRETFRSRAFWLVTCAFALAGLTVQLMNRSLFPLFDGVFTYARDISITCSALAAIGIGLVSLARPRALAGRRLSLAMLALWAVGGLLMAMGLGFRQPAVLVVGASLFVTSRGWTTMSANLVAVYLPASQAMAAVSLGVFLSQALDLLVRVLPLPYLAAPALLAACVAAGILLTATGVRRLTEEIASMPPATELSVTRPASYLPLTSNLYVCLILVHAAFGFALRFGEVAGAPAFGNLAVPLLLVVVALTLGTCGRFFGDALADVVILMAVAGFLLVIAGGSGNVLVANALLSAGSALFNVLLYTTLVALAGRNRLAALSIAGWGQGLAGLATTVGALLGTTSNALLAAGGHAQVALLGCAVTLSLVAYALIGLRGFSFRQTIEGVVPPEPVVDLERASGELFARRVQTLARRFALTPREAEVFEMLARGRNREYIEEHLGVSLNTVKAHVKHVYAKLGIHSHQELIDLFEHPGN